MRVAIQSLLALALVMPQVTASAVKGLYSRGTTDVCANVDAGLNVNVLGIPIDVGLLDICLCLSGIPALLGSNIIVETAVDLVGTALVKASLTSMVNSAKDHETCSYPDNASPLCSLGSPCGFGCKNGFSASPANKPTDCVCLPPFKVCNGVCDNFPSLCPSAHPKKRDAEILERRAVASCDAGFTACGVYGWQGFASTEAWECIDTTSDLESCGGCTMAFGRNPAHGVDCTAIPGVMDVACAAGTCIVHRCLPGYVVSLDGSFCIRQNAMTQLDGDINAAVYGLEHVPLKRTNA